MDTAPPHLFSFPFTLMRQTLGIENRPAMSTAERGLQVKRSNKWWRNQHTYADQSPISCIPVASPGLEPKGRGCEERMGRRSQTGQAWFELQSQ